MKKYMVAAAVLMMFVVMVGGAWAGDNKSLIVSADVADTCIGLDPGVASVLPISLDPMTPVAVTGGGVSVNPSIKCTKDSTHVVACTSAHGNQLTVGNDGATDPIPYTLTAGSCASPLTGNGSTAVDIPLAIDIANNAFLNAVAGLHSDTITITVTY
jgi:hypothetical protein